ncbi:heavy metal sensor histidine kinase [uncultured Kushneria sp.]|uniref:heavy metal sensor histidine kinase n=1 Tax=uncultured Kushneria sp. TaxID=905033 RepID=UPI0026153AB6|nr:heavy metal sensor histidine kinase [uncultured Kushneria sp.]
MKLVPRSLAWRLALMFALATVLLLGGIGVYLYHALEREIVWRDDQALKGRLERMTALLEDSDSLAVLRQRPGLYANMLDNRESLLWLLDDRGRALLEVNPVHRAVPELPQGDGVQLATLETPSPARLAWVTVRFQNQPVTLVAGRVLDERTRMLGDYRHRLLASLLGGALLALMLGYWIALRGLAPVRRLAGRINAIDTRHLHHRLPHTGEVSELRVLGRVLNVMLERLEQGFMQLSRFSEDLAHEMRTPLSNLMGQTQQAMQRDRSIEAYQTLLGSHLEEYERLSRMIDSMLFLARAEQADTALDHQPVDLNALAVQLCDYFEGMAEERGLTLAPCAHGQVHGDVDLLRRALANLIANALRYAYTNTTVTIGTRGHDGAVELYVCNDGPRIEPQHLPLVFERFYRIDASRQTPDDSGGLGLAIVRAIAGLHGGTASADNHGGGVCFSLRLPVAQSLS